MQHRSNKQPHQVLCMSVLYNFFPGRFYSECATPQPTLNVFVSPIGLSGCNRVFTISLSTPRLPQNMRPLITRANPASVVLLEIE